MIQTDGRTKSSNTICVGLVALLLALLAGGTDSCERSEFVSQVDNFFSNEFTEDEPGGAVLVMKENEVAFSRGYGLADLKSKEKITPQTLFNLGSVSKTFVANAILILASEGRLSLNDPLSKYFPDFKIPEIAQKVQIIHLLTHTSGLPDNRNVDANVDFYLTAKDVENFHPIKLNDTLHFEPGERFEYSNPAFNGLALIIEAVTGMKWQQFVTERIFVPAGMSESKITDGSYPETGVAHAYVKDSLEYREYDYGEFPTFAAAGNGGVWSSVEELTRYELAIQKSTFLSAGWINESRTVYSPPNWRDSLAPAIGYSWFIEKDSLGTRIYHAGSQGGFRAYYIFIPEKQILYVSLCNSPRPMKNYADKVLALLKQFDWLD